MVAATALRVQEVPLPEYPELHVHIVVSEVDFPEQAPDTLACASHVLHGVQLVPVPKYPALHVHTDVSSRVSLQVPDKVACRPQILHGAQL